MDEWHLTHMKAHSATSLSSGQGSNHTPKMGAVSEGQNRQKLDTITVDGFVGRQFRNTGKAWAATLTLEMWELSWQMWDHRNDILHNSDMYDHGCHGLLHYQGMARRPQ
jgi:hypothetical protein